VTGKVQQALSGLRYLIQLGIIQSYLSGTEPQYTEGHARTIYGVDARGQLMVMVSEGKYPNQGLTLGQAATLMQSYGAITAFDAGGGGDSEAVLDGKLLTWTENIDPVTGVHFERPLPQVLLVYPKGATGMKQYKVIWANGASKRTAPTTSSVSLAGGLLPLNTVWDVVQDNIPDQTFPTDTTKRWVKFPDGSFAASIYGAGSVRMQDVTVVTPPPPTFAHHLEVVLDGVVQFSKDFN
jgi:hypothetical protein